MNERISDLLDMIERYAYRAKYTTDPDTTRAIAVNIGATVQIIRNEFPQFDKHLKLGREDGL